MSSNNVLSRRNTAKISNQINEQKPSSFKNVLNIHIENPSTIHGRRKSSTMKLHQEMQQEPLKDEKEKEKEILSLHEILDKTPDTRNQKEVDLLYYWVMKNVSTNKIFQGVQEIICKTICREMTLLQIPAKGIVCYQGDYGDIFFIIISGSVSLYVDTRKKAREHDLPRYYDPRRFSIMGRLDEEDGAPADNYGSFIKQILAGGTFGELAVMDPTARRSCTVICDEDTSFICLKRGAYQRLIRNTNSTNLDFTQVEFLETLFLFAGWQHGEIIKISNRLRQMNFTADSYLSRIGTEANLIYFIYSGVVQESVPLIHYLNENGVVYKCTTFFEVDSTKRSMQEMATKDQFKRRICLELNVYQDHDICGEYTVTFNKKISTTDLLAVTDVKALVMDRETWKEIFFAHGVDHIREGYRKFRELAEARENWRQTRLQLALSSPGITLSISTKQMMQDGKCICGWCGSKLHVTGDSTCPNLVESKKKKASKAKKLAKKKFHRRLPEITARIQAMRIGLGFALTISHDETTDTVKAAKTLISEWQKSRKSIEPQAGKILHKRPIGNHPVSRKVAVQDLKQLNKASDILYEYEQNFVHNVGAANTEEESHLVRKAAFTQEVEDQYRIKLMKKVRRINSLGEYLKTRGTVLEEIQQDETKSAEEKMTKIPKRPKIPMPQRRTQSFQLNSRPTRFDRRINRMLRKIWSKEHQVPVVEESLRD